MSSREIPPNSGPNPSEGSSDSPEKSESRQREENEKATIESIVAKKMSGQPLSASEEAQYGTKDIAKKVDKEIVRLSKEAIKSTKPDLPPGRQRTGKLKANGGLDSLAAVSQRMKDKQELERIHAEAPEEIIEALQDRGLSTTGTPDQLIERLLNAGIDLADSPEEHKPVTVQVEAKKAPDIRALNAERRKKEAELRSIGLSVNPVVSAEAAVEASTSSEADKNEKVAEIVGSIKATLEKESVPTTERPSEVKKDSKQENIIPIEDLARMEKFVLRRRAGAPIEEDEVRLFNKYEKEINTLLSKPEVKKEESKKSEPESKPLVQEKVTDEQIGDVARAIGVAGVKVENLPENQKRIYQAYKDRIDALVVRISPPDKEAVKSLGGAQKINFFREQTKAGILPKNEENEDFLYKNFNEIVNDDETKLAYFAADFVENGDNPERTTENQVFINQNIDAINAKIKDFGGTTFFTKQEAAPAPVVAPEEAPKPQQPEKKSVSLAEQIKDYVYRYTHWEDMSSPEDRQFHADNGPAINEAIAVFAKQVEDLAKDMFINEMTEQQLSAEKLKFYKENEQNVDIAISRLAKGERNFEKNVAEVHANVVEDKKRIAGLIKDPEVQELITKMNLDMQYVYSLSPEFFDLDSNKQIYILDKIRQKISLDATFEAEDRVKKQLGRKAKSPLDWFNKRIELLTKEFQETKARREVIDEAKNSGLGDYAGDIEAMTKHVAKLDMNISYSAEGKPILEYVNPKSFEWDPEYIKRFKKSESPVEYVNRFNEAATAVSEMPHEWSQPNANIIDKMKYKKAWAKYEVQRDILFGAVVEQKKKEIPDNEEEASKSAMEWMTMMNSKVRMNQLLTEYPEIEQFENKGPSFNPEDLNSKEFQWTGKKALFAAGWFTKDLVRDNWAEVSAAIFAGGLGGLLGLRKKWVEYDDAEKRKRYGQAVGGKNIEKGIKKFINAGETADRLQWFLDKIESPEPGENIEKFAERLKNHLAIIDERISSGRVNYGDKKESLINKIKIIEKMAEAQTKLFTMGQFNEVVESQSMFNKFSVTMNKWLPEAVTNFFDKHGDNSKSNDRLADRFDRSQKDSQAMKAKAAQLTLAFGKGAALAATAFGAGWLVREGWDLIGSGPAIPGRTNDLIDGSEGGGNEVPRTPTPGVPGRPAVPEGYIPEADRETVPSVLDTVPKPPSSSVLDNVPKPPEPGATVVIEETPEPKAPEATDSTPKSPETKSRMKEVLGTRDDGHLDLAEMKKNFQISKDASGGFDIDIKNINDFDKVKAYIKNPIKFVDFSQTDLPANLEKPQWGIQAMISAKGEIKEFLATQQYLEELEKADPKSGDIPALKEHMKVMGGEIRAKMAEFYRKNAGKVIEGKLFKPFEDWVGPTSAIPSSMDDATASLDGGGGFIPPEPEQEYTVYDPSETPKVPSPEPVSTDTSAGQEVVTSPPAQTYEVWTPPAPVTEAPTPVEAPTEYKVYDSGLAPESVAPTPEPQPEPATEYTVYNPGMAPETSPATPTPEPEQKYTVYDPSEKIAPEVTKTASGEYSLEKTPTSRVIEVDNEYMKGKITLVEDKSGVVKEIYDVTTKDLDPDKYFVENWKDGLTAKEIEDKEIFLRAYLNNQDMIVGQVVEEGDKFYNAVDARVDLSFEKIKDVLKTEHMIAEEADTPEVASGNVSEATISKEEMDVAKESGVEVEEAPRPIESTQHGELKGEYVSELQTSPTERVISFNNPDGEVRGQIQIVYDEKTGEVEGVKYSKDTGSLFSVRQEVVWAEHMEDNWRNNLGTRSSMGVEIEAKRYIRYKGILQSCGFKPGTPEYKYFNGELEAIIKKSGKFIKEETIFPSKG